MRLTYLITFAILINFTNCEEPLNKKAAIHYLEIRSGVRLAEPPKCKKFTCVDFHEASILKKDLQMICILGTIKNLYINNSVIKQGAISGLQDCDKLEHIQYENTRFESIEDIQDHNLISKTPGLVFRGSIYGDDVMEQIGRLHKISGFGISGDYSKNNGSVTNEGIKRFVEAHTGDQEIGITLEEPKVDAKGLNYLMDLKGLKWIQLGEETPITWHELKAFTDAYKEKYGVKLDVNGPIRWANEFIK